MSKQHKIGNIGHTGEISEDRLLAYIEGILPPDEQHQLEELLEADPFLNDAVDGLSAVKDKEQLKLITDQINHHLKRQIQNRRKHRRTRPKLTDHWGWLFVLIILLLILVSWWVIKLMGK